MKAWESIETGLLYSTKYKYEILQSGESYKVVFRGNKDWNKWFKYTRYYKTNPQNIDFGLTVRTV